MLLAKAAPPSMIEQYVKLEEENGMTIKVEAHSFGCTATLHIIFVISSFE